jgi:molybdate/tungstate transport system substrate-binding protein
MRITFSLLLITMLLIMGCNQDKKQNIIIFHAGSLSVPVKKISEAFEKANPRVRVLSEAAGSLQCARKITEMGKMCDILLSADYSVIDAMLIPEYASWNIRFATNGIVIAYRPESAYASIFREDNWADILLKDDVIIGRADPDADPCGYRTVFAARLAEEYYGKPGLADSLLNKNSDYIRPKEVDLVALTETGVIDYMFQYKSVAIQHGFKYLELPDSINLSSPDMKDHYSSVSCMIPGETPGVRHEIRGDYISYSGTIPDGALHKELAVEYFSFLLSEEGRKVFIESGQLPLTPVVTGDTAAIPAALKSYINITPGQ